jgi:tRNA(Ser,Leu) C12 N-acetylase TAN1
MRTSFYNVLTVQVENPHTFLSEFAAAVANTPHLLKVISRVVPAHHTFHFLTREEFEQKMRDILHAWLPELAGASFHVRIRRRGGRKVLSPRAAERFLDDMLLRALEAQGTPGRINFDDPDKIIQIETINDRAGVSLWSREHRLNYPFLGID